MLSKITNFFAKIAHWINPDTLNGAIQLFLVALPYLDLAAEIVSGLTPTKVDDITLRTIKVQFPRLFSGEPMTVEEFKLYTLGVATELLKAHSPGTSTTIARIAAQVAYLRYKAGETDLTSQSGVEQR